MNSSNMMATGLGFLGVTILGAWFMLNSSAGVAEAQVASDGPKMAITVAGEANGEIVIQLLPEVAPQHVARFEALIAEGAYDNVVFHRVIPGFMAQTGDVQFGIAGENLARAGMGKSELPNLPAEFSELSFERGMVGMARSASPNSANSQFFIMFAPAPHLNGQYTIVGQVLSGMDVVDGIKPGTGVPDPDVMTSVVIVE